MASPTMFLKYSRSKCVCVQQLQFLLIVLLSLSCVLSQRVTDLSASTVAARLTSFTDDALGVARTQVSRESSSDVCVKTHLHFNPALSTVLETILAICRGVAEGIPGSPEAPPCPPKNTPHAPPPKNSFTGSKNNNNRNMYQFKYTSRRQET